MRSTEYLNSVGRLRVEKLPRGRGKSKAKQIIHDEKWRLANLDIPTVIAGNGGRTDAVQTRTDLCNYFDNLG